PGSNDLPTRRRVLGTAAGAAVLGASALGLAPEAVAQPGSGKTIKNGRIRQSLVHWCYAPHFELPRMIQVARQLGCGSIELLEPKYFPMLKAAGLECAIGTIDMSPDPPFAKGFNNPKYRERVVKATLDAIDACAGFGYKNVIAFTGYAEGI